MNEPRAIVLLVTTLATATGPAAQEHAPIPSAGQQALIRQRVTETFKAECARRSPADQTRLALELCSAADRAKDVLESARPGEKITLRCFCQGLDGHVILKSCIRP